MSAIRPVRGRAEAEASRELQHAAAPAYFAQVQLGGAKPEPERTPEVFHMIQLAALQAMVEAGGKAIRHEVGGNLELNITGCRVAISHVVSPGLLNLI